MATQGIHPEELAFLLKVCLNKMDYDSITEFLKLLNLDKVIPEILFNLLLIDKPVAKESISLREFNKEFLVHSSIFEKLGVSRELTWALFRGLKGDYIIFKKMLGTLYEDCSINHKFYLNIVVSMISLKNVRFNSSEPEIDWEVGYSDYVVSLRKKFKNYNSGVKEISLEYALYSMNKYLKTNPLWVTLICFKPNNRTRKNKGDKGNVDIMGKSIPRASQNFFSEISINLEMESRDPNSLMPYEMSDNDSSDMSSDIDEINYKIDDFYTNPSDEEKDLNDEENENIDLESSLQKKRNMAHGS